jgi:hypothetical protein
MATPCNPINDPNPDPKLPYCAPAAPIHIDVTDVATQEIDPANFAKLQGSGFEQSGIIERLVVALFTGIIKLLLPIIRLAGTLFDQYLVLIGTLYQAAQGQKTAEFYKLCAVLMEDLTGIEVDGDKLANDFQQNGRLAAMEELGGGLINALAAEFTGVKQLDSGGAFSIQPGTGVGGLPDQTLTPEQGVNGARALMGFVTSFAVREGNTDVLADYIPGNILVWFKDFAEDFSKSLGIGRLARIGFKPLFQTLIAVPLQWALNIQYTPTQLNPREIMKAYNAGLLSNADMRSAMQRHGYSEAYIQILIQDSYKGLELTDIQTLRATGGMSDVDATSALQSAGFSPQTVQLILKTWDVEPLRKSALAAAHRFVAEFIAGDLTSDEFNSAIDGLTNISGGAPVLSDGEVRGLKGLGSNVAAFPRKHLTVGQLTTALEEGLIDISEFESALTRFGYDLDAVTILGTTALIKQKKLKSSAPPSAHTSTGSTPTTT